MLYPNKISELNKLKYIFNIDLILKVSTKFFQRYFFFHNNLIYKFNDLSIYINLLNL